MNITQAGIGSKLDLEGIIEAYINAEAIPREIRLQRKEERLNTELSGVGQFKSALSSFESILKKLSDTSDFNKQNVSVSNGDITAETNGFASNGNFEINVVQLATGSKYQSQLVTSDPTTVGSGTLTFDAGGNSFNVAIDATDDLKAIRDKINEASDNIGIVANVINVDGGSYLTYTSELTGATNNLTVSTSDASLAAISTSATQTQTAQDAIIEVDGNSVSQASNVFKNIIEDVTITAVKETAGDKSQLSVTQDKENGKKLIDDFIKSYNTLIDNLDFLSEPENGKLAFDPNIRAIKGQMSTIVIDAVSGLSGSISSLGDIGITLNKDGRLEASSIPIGTMPSGSEKLDSALESNLDEIGELFASSNGVTSQLLTLVESYNGSDGSLTLRKTSLSAEVKGLEDEWQALEDRLRDYEDTLRKRFAFLDQTVAVFNATGDFITNALANSPTSSSKK
ncbi:flagellar filament capping protein FliD [Thalassotalea marina]|uniref:Flagellar hook-associated protein 2 n=1 Tax=Thalassotalea marina TaxID=1673741 RepID=A0A919BB76_9GAMM|nr:flagellar filament capping protein FliD [Thalassotalea marina]GHF80291.1 flagellar hook-associated protein 2 [Thalassotalea marina]